MGILGRTGIGAGLLAAIAANGVAADPHWVKARLGSFEAISDDGRRSATQALSQFEQFRFALGSVLGQPDLRLEPALRIIVYKNAQDLQNQCPPGLITGRDRIMACTTAEGQLPAGLLRDLTRRLLENNLSKMPPPIETALETFFTTVQSTAVHVTWGTPPPPAERTREWALLHRIITQPDTAAQAHIYLHNLAAGTERGAASRNAFGADSARFETEVDQYYAAGIFGTAVAPNRPLNPDRDFNTTFLTSDEGQLMRADLLNAASAAIYQSLLQAGKQTAEANEGLAMLALRDKDLAKAQPYMEAARKAGTHNFVALTTYAGLLDDPARAIEILKEALTLDPKYAEAHWVFGEKLRDQPPRMMMEWKQAVNLAPRNYEWAARYAELCMDLKQYAEAGRAWMAAAQAAPNADLREQYLSARSHIEEQRLAAEDAERRREAAAKAAEMDRLKNEARKELAQLEARANGNPLSAEEKTKVVEWFDDSGTQKLTGSLVRVQCAGKQLRLSVKNDAGETLTFLVPDAKQFEIRNGDSLACGAQKPMAVSISFKPAAKGSKDAGEATLLDFQR